MKKKRFNPARLCLNGHFFTAATFTGPHVEPCSLVDLLDIITPFSNLHSVSVKARKLPIAPDASRVDGTATRTECSLLLTSSLNDLSRTCTRFWNRRASKMVISE